MIARISKKLTGENWFAKAEQRENIIDERNKSGKINILMDSLFKAKEDGDYEEFKHLVAEMFLEEEGNYFYIRKLFESNVSKEDLIKEIDGNNCYSVCVLLDVI
ncbi:hypothetical protein [Terrisporobacter mayombei]|uniref:Uncharacterized protein n=1 Tax=Terrisporobacter mayombei TaxID=1541 RepID=A0ABY9Q0V7_9FIRM|nr:hypothetical protein [Terrisporobacter mayombei]MCC3866977.1 hypothetical protein [Terrisporobacter mayombei]WMT81226.1 hypothetical protein TEMA_15600 [Terrisporobacter mayombei]